MARLKIRRPASGALLPALLLSLARCGPCAGPVADEPEPKIELDAEQARELEASWREGRLPKRIPAGEPRRGGTVTIRAYYEPDSLNPLSSGDGMARWIVLHNVAETLVRTDPCAHAAAKILPSLATRWEVDESGTAYTFHLRPGVQWHDGVPLTSRDVAATFEKLTDPMVFAGALGPLYGLLESVEAKDEHTVELTWKKPYFLALDTIAKTPIQPAHVIEDLCGRTYNEAVANPLNRAPMGTGPFHFVRWETNTRIILERNDDWWGEGPWIERVVYEILPDDDEANRLAAQGDLDVWDAVEPGSWARMGESSPLARQYHRCRWEPAAHVLIGWNGRREHLACPAIRRSLAMLLNRDALVAEIGHGLVRPATCHFAPDGPDCDPSISPLPFDREAALEGLLAAGWKDTTGDGLLDRDGASLRIAVMIHEASVSSERIAAMMARDFRNAGIDVRTHEVEWPVFTRRLRAGEFDAAVLMRSPGPASDPIPYWHSASQTGGANHFGFSSERADALMETARHELDDGSRQEKFRELGRIIHEKQPVTFLYHPSYLALVHQRLRGVRPSHEWWQPVDWWIEDTQPQ